MNEIKHEFIARVRNGRLVLDEPIDLPEGTEVELEVSDLEALDRALLKSAIVKGVAEDDAGQVVDGREVIAELREKREKP